MPRSATGHWIKRRQAGFTLLEVMVVLVLIGIITGFAILSARGGGEDERLAIEARRLATLMELNRQEAILRTEQRGVHFTATGYRFLAFSREGGWDPPAASNLLRAHELPSGFTLQLQVEGQPVDFTEAKDPPQPQVLLLSSGEVTDFTLTLRTRDHSGYRLSGDLTGNLDLQSAQ